MPVATTRRRTSATRSHTPKWWGSEPGSHRSCRSRRSHARHGTSRWLGERPCGDEAGEAADENVDEEADDDVLGEELGEEDGEEDAEEDGGATCRATGADADTIDGPAVGPR